MISGWEPMPTISASGKGALHPIKWRSKFGGMDASLMARMRELEDENRRLKKMYADVQLQRDVLDEAMRKKW
jgi:putative transposase